MDEKIVVNSNKKKIVKDVLFALFVLLGLLIGALSFILFKDSEKFYSEIKEVSTGAVLKEVLDDNSTKLLDSKSRYEDINLFKVDLEKYRAKNPDVAGWINVEGTDVNYPFVKGNGDYYNSHDINRDRNVSGWLYMDSKSDIDSLDKNTVFYQEGFLEKIKVGTLKNIMNNDDYKYKKNQFIRIASVKSNYLFQVFSIYKTSDFEGYSKNSFKDNDEFLKFGNEVLNRSKYNMHTNLKESDRILTISTKVGSERIVMHAKLIKEGKVDND